MVKTKNDNEATARLESALYSAGRPLSIEDLIKASGTESRPKTLALLDSIMKKTKNAFRVKKYASKPILSRATQKTLSYIAFEQPVSSKQLVEIRGSGVYGHLKELRQLDFIKNQNIGRLKIYSTTEKFQKYFGIPGDADILKQKLFKRVRKASEITSS